MTPNSTPDATVILEAGKTIGQRAPVLVDGEEAGQFVAVSRDVELRDLQKYFPRPRRIETHVDVADPGSFIAYVLQFCDEQHAPMVFADYADGVTAVLDYHQSPVLPLWGEHTVNMPFQYARAAGEWIAANGQKMNQLTFATFVENHIPQIAAPNGGDLLEMTLTFEATKSVDFQSNRRLQDGSTQFTFNETTAQGMRSNTAKIPSTMILKMPLFRNTPDVQIEAKIRFRIEAEGKLTIWFELVDLADIVEAAKIKMIESIRAGLGAKVRAVILGTLADIDD